MTDHSRRQKKPATGAGCCSNGSIQGFARQQGGRTTTEACGEVMRDSDNGWRPGQFVKLYNKETSVKIRKL